MNRLLALLICSTAIITANSTVKLGGLTYEVTWETLAPGQDIEDFATRERLIKSLNDSFMLIDVYEPSQLPTHRNRDWTCIQNGMQMNSYNGGIMFCLPSNWDALAHNIGIACMPKRIHIFLPHGHTIDDQVPLCDFFANVNANDAWHNIRYQMVKNPRPKQSFFRRLISYLAPSSILTAATAAVWWLIKGRPQRFVEVDPVDGFVPNHGPFLYPQGMRKGLFPA
jgi:hypothetical protein